MRRYLVLLLAAAAFLIAAPSAFATHIIFDPPPSSGGTDCTISSGSINDYSPCTAKKLNTAYSVSFVDCTTLGPGLAGPTPGSNPAPGWCVFMDNATGKTLHSFSFNFSVPSSSASYDGLDTLSCSSQPTGFATNNCPEGSQISAGDPLSLSFFSATGVSPGGDFYLITDFKFIPDPAQVTVSVPEPDELGLFGLGLLAVGVGVVWQKRRQVSGNRDAA